MGTFLVALLKFCRQLHFRYFFLMSASSVVFTEADKDFQKQLKAERTHLQMLVSLTKCHLNFSGKFQYLVAARQDPVKNKTPVNEVCVSFLHLYMAPYGSKYLIYY